MIGLLPVIYGYALVHHSHNLQFLTWKCIKYQHVLTYALQTNLQFVDTMLVQINTFIFSWVGNYMNPTLLDSKKEKDIKTNMSPNASCRCYLHSFFLDLVVEKACFPKKAAYQN